MDDRAAVLVLPTGTSGQQGPVAAWVSAAGWASATARVLGESWIVTPEGVVEPEEARRRGSRPELSTTGVPGWRRRVPTVAKTLLKDVRQWRRARRFSVDTNGPWTGRDLAFVWQRHELFHTAGLRLARALAVPSVLFVPAPIVWEATQWGVARPGWRRILEQRGEGPALRGADLVACGSDAVAEQVGRIGVPDARILVTPTGVDLDLFDVAPDETLRRRLGLGPGLVVGWVGSFRSFHALELAVEAVARVEGTTLLLVGDGPERAGIEAAARARGVELVTTGTVAHTDLPAYLGVMDVGLVVAGRDQAFHYSPLKLAEYLAAGLPVVAPRVAQLARRLEDGVDAALVPPGDVDALAAVLIRLRDDPAERHRLTAGARAVAARWSWDHQVRRVLGALG